MALERTAQVTVSGSVSPATSTAYASRMSASRSAGKGCSSIQARTRPPSWLRAATSSTSIPSTASRMRAARSPWERKRPKASEVVANPGGTRMPADARCDTISPSEAFLPPTRARSPMPISSKRRMLVM